MPTFDYHGPAELFSNPGQGKRRHPLGYRRFDSGAEALRFIVEQVPAALVTGIILEADEQRFDHRAIRDLYDSPEYPLVRDVASD